MSNLIHNSVIQQLLEIGQAADAQRLMVWKDEFASEYPELYKQISAGFACATAPELAEWLLAEFPALKIACRLMGPEWTAKFNQSVSFIHAQMHQHKGEIK